jgi:hypothetical protein
MGGTMVVVTPALLMASSSCHGLSNKSMHTKTYCIAARKAPSATPCVICRGCHRMGAKELMQKRALYVFVR